MKFIAKNTVWLPRCVVDIYWEPQHLRIGFCGECRQLLYMLAYPYPSEMLLKYMSQRIGEHLKTYPSCRWEKIKP